LFELFDKSPKYLPEELLELIDNEPANGAEPGKLRGILWLRIGVARLSTPVFNGMEILKKHTTDFYNVKLAADGEITRFFISIKT